MHFAAASGRRARWTLEEEQALVSSLAAGKTIYQVAQLLGRSQGAVHSKSLTIDAIPKRSRAVGQPRNCPTRNSGFFLS
jgi:hypothetical protein